MLEDDYQRPEAVGPADFFAFGKGAAVIGNAHLIETVAFFTELDSDLRFKAKIIFNQVNRLDGLFPESLVASFDIGEIQIGEQIGQESDQAITQVMAEEHHPVRIRTDKARAINHIGVAVENWLQQFAVFCRVVFQIGVLN